MSKIKMLLDVVSDLRSLADSVQALADGMSDTRAVPDTKPENAPEKPEAKEPEIKLEDVRTVLAKKSSEGFTKEIKELLKKHGADRLSEIDPSEYAQLLSDAEVLGNE